MKLQKRWINVNVYTASCDKCAFLPSKKNIIIIEVAYILKKEQQNCPLSIVRDRKHRSIGITILRHNRYPTTALI